MEQLEEGSIGLCFDDLNLIKIASLDGGKASAGERE